MWARNGVWPMPPATRATDLRPLRSETRCRAGPRPRPSSPTRSRCQQAGHLADDEVDDVDADGSAGVVEHRVVQRERPAEERVAAAGKRSMTNWPGRMARASPGCEADAIGVPGQPDVFDDRGSWRLQRCGHEAGVRRFAVVARPTCAAPRVPDAEQLARTCRCGSRSSLHRADGDAPQRHHLVPELGQHAADLAVLALGQDDPQPGAVACCLSRLTRLAWTWPSLSQTPSSSCCSRPASGCRAPARGRSSRRRSAGASAGWPGRRRWSAAAALRCPRRAGRRCRRAVRRAARGRWPAAGRPGRGWCRGSRAAC